MKRAPAPFGLELRRLRTSRGYSQLVLARLAGTPARHVSFLETGRSRPSHELVLRLARALDVPMREKNRLLVMAGLPPAFPERPMDDESLAPLRAIVEQLLERHEPFPGLVFDRRHEIVRMNGAAKRMLAQSGEDDWIDAIFAKRSPLRAALENADEVGWATMEMLLREPPSSERDAVCARLSKLIAPQPPSFSASPVVCARFRFGDRVVRAVSTVARFGMPRDVAVDELRVELVFPADAASAAFFRDQAGS